MDFLDISNCFCQKQEDGHHFVSICKIILLQDVSCLMNCLLWSSSLLKTLGSETRNMTIFIFTVVILFRHLNLDIYFVLIVIYYFCADYLL